MSGPAKILVVEDDPLIAMELGERLEEMGYAVLGPAHSIEAAEQAVARERPDAALLEQAEEKAVAAALQSADATAEPALLREDFTAAMSALAALRGPLDAFFEKVTVNLSARPDLRLNRLRLLRQISGTIDHVADFSKIEG